MVFNSIHFIAFFLVVYAVYRTLPHRPQNVFLLLASFFPGGHGLFKIDAAEEAVPRQAEAIRSAGA